MSKIADKILSRIKTKATKKHMPQNDLMMIAEELVSALTDDNCDGVADALRAAFSCMSGEKTGKYAEGGMVDNEDDEDEYDEYENEEPTKVVYQSPDQQDSAPPVSWKEDATKDLSMVYVADRPEYQTRNNKFYTDEDLEENERVWKRNTDASINIANQTGSYIGETIDEDLMDLVLGDPEKYVEVRSNPDAYDRFQKAYQKAFDDRDPEEGMDVGPIWEMLYDPEFWKSLRTQSFNNESAYKLAQQQLVQSGQQRLAPEQQAVANAQQAAAESRKPELVELRDPNRNVTVLTDKPAKALRRQPALKVVPKKPAAKPALPRTIQMGPLR